MTVKYHIYAPTHSKLNSRENFHIKQENRCYAAKQFALKNVDVTFNKFNYQNIRQHTVQKIQIFHSKTLHTVLI
jgi:hypothetical protein